MTARPTSGPGSGAAWPRNPADGQTVQDLLAELGNTELTKGWLPAPAVKETPGPADPGWSGTRNQQSLTRWNQLPGLRFQGHLGQRHANRLVRFRPVLIDSPPFTDPDSRAVYAVWPQSRMNQKLCHWGMGDNASFAPGSGWLAQRTLGVS
jgi:hypothetical protein